MHWDDERANPLSVRLHDTQVYPISGSVPAHHWHVCALVSVCVCEREWQGERLLCRDVRTEQYLCFKIAKTFLKKKAESICGARCWFCGAASHIVLCMGDSARSRMLLWMKKPACKNEFKSECRLQARLTIYKCKNATYYLFCWPLAFYPDKSLVRTVPLVSLVDRTIFLCLMRLHHLLLHGQQLADSFLFS